jgi:hypothetical protein
MTDTPSFMILYTVSASNNIVKKEGSTIEITPTTDYALLEPRIQYAAIRATIAELRRIEKIWARKVKESFKP